MVDFTGQRESRYFLDETGKPITQDAFMGLMLNYLANNLKTHDRYQGLQNITEHPNMLQSGENTNAELNRYKEYMDNKYADILKKYRPITPIP